MLTHNTRPIDTHELLFRGMDFVPIPLLISESNDPNATTYDTGRKHIFINKAFTQQMGYDIHDLPDIETWFTKAYPDPQYSAEITRNWTALVEDSLRKGLPSTEIQCLVQLKNGTHRWFHITAELHSATLPNCHMVAFLDIHDLTVALEENSRLSRTDELTGLPNRREAQSSLDSEWLRFQRTGMAFSVLLCDIDYFKRVNDQRGHLVGDLALRAVAAQLTHCCRTMDCVSRWGGEEFLIILPQTDLVQATELAERIRMRIADLVIDTDSRPLSLHLSIGCAMVQPGQSVQALLGQSDTALYAAKATGRNRVCVA